MQPVRNEGLKKELSLIQLVLDWESSARGESKKQLSDVAKHHLSSETNIKLEQKGLTLKERMALKQYLKELKEMDSIVMQINSSALLCPMFISLGAWSDLVLALHRILEAGRKIVDEVGVASGGGGEQANDGGLHAHGTPDDAGQRKIKIDSVLCRGKNAILKRHDFKLSEIVQDCESFQSLARSLLGSEISRDKEDEDGIDTEEKAPKPSAASWLGRNSMALTTLLKVIKSAKVPSSSTNSGAISMVRDRSMQQIDMQVEIADPLQINELVLHFVAIRLPDHVRAVYLTVDFYSLPRIRAGPLKISTAKCDGLRTIQRDYLAPFVPDSLNPGVGNSIKLTVTPEMAGSTQPADFAHYLCSHDLDIDVWDAESCLALGTLRVRGLHRVLRQGQSAVQIIVTPPFVTAAPEDGAVLPATSGKDPQVEVALVSGEGTQQPGALIRIVNRGHVNASDAQSESVASPGGASLESHLVKSWRTDAVQPLSPVEDLASGSRAISGMGMAAILQARKFQLAKDKGRIPQGNVVPIDTRAAAVVGEHATALKNFRANPSYQLRGMADMIKKLSVKDVEMCPVFGQTDFEYKHHISNPHDHVVVCMASTTSVDLDNVALEMRENIIQGLHISGGVLRPAQANEHVMPNAQTWLLQPQAQAVMSVKLDNKPEHWQLESFVLTVQVTFMRQSELSSQYNLRVTVRPLPVVLDRHLRFFVDVAQENLQPFKRLVQVDSRTLSSKRVQPQDSLTVRTVPEAGVESKIVSINDEQLNDIRVCHLSVMLSEITPDSGFVAKESRVPGWEKQPSWRLFVLLCDKAGAIVECWRVELVGVQSAEPDSRNRSVKITLSPSLQDNLFGCRRQFYSSDWERLPSYREREATVGAAEMESEEPSPTFAIGRGFSKPIFVMLVRQNATKGGLEGNPHGFFHSDALLFPDDVQGLRFARVIGSIEKVLGELRKAGQPSCSDAQWRRVKESGILAFKESAACIERTAPAQDDLVKALHLLSASLRDHRESKSNASDVLPESCRDPTFAQRPRDDMFCPSPLQTAKVEARRGDATDTSKVDATPWAKGSSQFAAELVRGLTIWHAAIVGVWRVRPAGGAADIEDEEEDNVITAAEDDAVRKRRGPKPVIRFESVFHLWVPRKVGQGDGLARKMQAEALGES